AVGACLNDDNGADSGSAYVFELVPSITKSVSSELLNPGDALTYTLDFYSGITATSVLITDVIPAQLASYTYTSTGALITSTGGTDYVWQVQDLYPGDSGVITITGVVSPDLTSGYAFSNTATIDSSESGEQSSVIVRVPFWVTGVEPDPKSNYASLDTNLTITLNESISQSTVTSRTIVVHGGFQGHLDGNISFGSIIYDPGNDLHPGEIVQTSVTTGVLSQDDVSIWPYVWQFRTAAGIGPVIFDHFIDSFGVASDETRSVVYGDVDGDGDLDLVVGNVSGQNLVYLNDGGVQGGTPGTFDNITRTFGTGSDSTYSVALGDVDEDGDLDIVVGNNGQNVVYLNDGDGTFDTTANTFGTGSDYTLSIALGDVDGDGDLDIAAGNWNSQQNVLYLNNGGVQGGTPGTFDTIAHNFGTGSDRTYSVALGDMDGDGDLDIAVGNWDEPNVIYLNDGDVWSGTPGTFDNTSHNFGTGSDDTTKIALGDVDDDGDLDIAVGNSNEQNRVYLNDNDGTFDTTTHDFGTGGDTTWSTALGDVDGDGDLDLVAGNWNGQNVIYLNDSDGTFDTITRTFGTGSDSTLDMALGDVDGDGDLDITVGNWTLHQSANYLNEALADLAIAKTAPA
ncbi:MAG: DUF11 domain-containing protein, partial [Chloroflexi bacterium]|nr:DUF11 domain-containing protein [Chloroflexota bacterium]